MTHPAARLAQSCDRVGDQGVGSEAEPVALRAGVAAYLAGAVALGALRLARRFRAQPVAFPAHRVFPSVEMDRADGLPAVAPRAGAAAAARAAAGPLTAAGTAAQPPDDLAHQDPPSASWSLMATATVAELIDLRQVDLVGTRTSRPAISGTTSTSRTRPDPRVTSRDELIESASTVDTLAAGRQPRIPRAAWRPRRATLSRALRHLPSIAGTRQRPGPPRGIPGSGPS